jgi:hypothetical protein
MPQPAPQLVPVNLLAKRLRLPAWWLRRQAESGAVPAINAGGVWLADRDAVESTLVARAHGRADPATTLGLDDMAALVGVSRSWLSVESLLGRIPSVIDNGQTWFHPTEVRAAMARSYGLHPDRGADPRDIELVSLSKAHRAIGADRKAVLRLIREGRLPVYRAGGTRWVSRSLAVDLIQAEINAAHGPKPKPKKAPDREQADGERQENTDGSVSNKAGPDQADSH